MALIILKIHLKIFIILSMVRSDLVIAGSNFIFSHIFENYKKYISGNKKRKIIGYF